jgi:dihydrofolate reductase
MNSSRFMTGDDTGKVRKVILFMVMSIDGFVGGPNGELDWEARDEDVSRDFVVDMQSTVDTMLLGRVLFQGFEQAWPAMASNPSSPKEIVDFANWIENSQKIVFTKTLENVGWKNSRLVSVSNDEDIAKEVKKLKQQTGGDMVVFGGARFAATLAQLGLIDEYRLKLQPVALGKGLALFNERMNLKLVKCKAYESGVVGLYFQPIQKTS